MKNNFDLETFKKEFFYIGDRVVEKATDKVYYCPYDLGFKFSIEDCKISCCKDCWGEAITSLKFKEVNKWIRKEVLNE